MPAWIVPAIAAAGSLITTLISQNRQKKENRKLAEFQASANTQFMREQNEYNTPKNQMLRYQDANLNPNLIYGQGNPGNQSSPQQYPEIQKTNYQNINLDQLIPMMNQSRMVQSQVQALDATTRQKTIMAELNQLQMRVMEKNPLLDEAGFKAIIDSLKSSAEIKASDSTLKTQLAEWSTGEKKWEMNGEPMHGPAGALKMETELQLLLKRFDLSVQDQSIKAQILKSKEFQNSILEVQKKFMTDAEVTPQHILQFIQLLLMKIL